MSRRTISLLNPLSQGIVIHQLSTLLSSSNGVDKDGKLFFNPHNRIFNVRIRISMATFSTIPMMEIIRSSLALVAFHSENEEEKNNGGRTRASHFPHLTPYYINCVQSPTKTSAVSTSLGWRTVVHLLSKLYCLAKNAPQDPVSMLIGNVFPTSAHHLWISHAFVWRSSSWPKVSGEDSSIPI